MAFAAFLLFLHVLSVVLWVGGMFFAYVCLRPAAGAVLEPPYRLRLWTAVFRRFFVWVWAAVIVILLSGLAMLRQAELAAVPVHWHLMAGGGVLMMAIFVYVFLGPYASLRRAVTAEDWKAGGAALNRIRQAVGFNLVLGVAVIAAATLGRALV